MGRHGAAGRLHGGAFVALARSGGKYQLKQHFEGARLPHVAADRSSILTVHALDQCGQLPGSKRAVVNLLGFEASEGLVERIQERHRLQRDGSRQLCRTLHRCRLAVVILAEVLIVLPVTSGRGAIMGSTWAIETTLAAAALELCPRNGAHALVGCAAGSTTFAAAKI